MYGGWGFSGSNNSTNNSRKRERQDDILESLLQQQAQSSYSQGTTAATAAAVPQHYSHQTSDPSGTSAMLPLLSTLPTMRGNVNPSLDTVASDRLAMLDSLILGGQVSTLPPGVGRNFALDEMLMLEKNRRLLQQQSYVRNPSELGLVPTLPQTSPTGNVADSLRPTGNLLNFTGVGNQQYVNPSSADSLLAAAMAGDFAPGVGAAEFLANRRRDRLAALLAQGRAGSADLDLAYATGDFLSPFSVRSRREQSSYLPAHLLNTNVTRQLVGRSRMVSAQRVSLDETATPNTSSHGQDDRKIEATEKLPVTHDESETKFSESPERKQRSAKRSFRRDYILERQQPKPFPRTHRPPICLAISTDSATLSAYQCYLRKHIECFETEPEDVSSKAQGRNTPIVVGQIGIRCIYCAKMNAQQRISGSAFYSQSLHGIYQIAQNMCKTHFLSRCPNMPASFRDELTRLQKNLNRGSGGKGYWKVAAQELGIYEDDGILKFLPDFPERKEASSSDDAAVPEPPS